MPGSAAIRAGEAFWEVTLKDKTSQPLKRVQGNLLSLATGVKLINTAFNAIGSAVKTSFSTATDVITKSVTAFMDISKFARDTGVAIAGIDTQKGNELNDAWSAFKAVLQANLALLGQAFAGPLTEILHLAINVGIGLFQAGKACEVLVDALMAIGAAAISGGNAFGIFGDFAGTAISGILAALGNGDIVRAFDIIASAVTAIWHGAMAGLQQALVETINFIVGTMQGAVGAMLAPIKMLEKTLRVDLGSAAIESASGAMAAVGHAVSGGIAISAAASGGEAATAMAELAALSGAERERFARRMAAIGDFAAGIGGPTARGGGSSRGQFGGMGAAMALGVGSGGGQKVTDDETHRLLRDTIKAIDGIEGGGTFK